MVGANVAETTIEAAIEWLRFTHPVSEHFAAQVRRTDLSGKRLAGWMHLLPDTILTLMPFVEAGVSVAEAEDVLLLDWLKHDDAYVRSGMAVLEMNGTNDYENGLRQYLARYGKQVQVDWKEGAEGLLQ